MWTAVSSRKRGTVWLIVPLVFILSWRTCRRIGQAINETAAWIVGYLLTAGVIWVTDVGGIDVVAANPIGTGAVIAYSGGFVGMLVSRYRWKRRGGHLRPADDRLSRAIRAMRTPPATAARQGAPSRSAPSTSSARPTAARPAASSSTASVGGRNRQAGQSPEVSIGRALGSAVRSATTRRDGKPNRWVRAFNAMLNGDADRARRK